VTDYILRRLLLIIPTLLGISLITFLVVQLAPGDPTLLKKGAQDAREPMSQEVILQTRKLYGLDKPLPERYWIWLKQMVTFNFGESFVDHRPVTAKILERLPISLQLSIISITLAYLIAIPLGVSSAVHRLSFFDHVSTFILFVLYSLPNFWIALLLILFLGGGDFLNVFPIYGLSSPGAESLSSWAWMKDRAWHLVLPVFCLTYGSLAGLSRYTRSAMLDVIRQDYIRTARAKGLPERLVIYRHALRNSLIPIVTLLAFQLPAILGGSVIIESIFSIQGMGKLAFESILSRDYPVIMGIATISSLLTLVGFLLGDIIYVVVDPRIRYT
jgi:peptide/nickel transport system permease protein